VHNAYAGRYRIGYMVELTLLEVDVDVESVSAYAPFARSVGDGETGGEAGPGVEVERSGGRRVKAGLAAALVGLVFLVAAALLLRRYVTESDEAADDLKTAEVAIE
jgi:hypothetical protein